MASKKQTIVIKKIIVQQVNGHSGSWKVALADFMTAMMAFFLVMWLIGQNDETKKAISDYFSTPSMIEYNFQNFGAEITLEKLFLDFVNEPLKAFQSFMEPADKTPNILDMGSAKVVAAFMADKMTDKARNVNISQDGFEFDIPDHYLFIRGTSNPKAEFVSIVEKLIGVTSGLQDSEIKITSALFVQLVPDQSMKTAERVSQERLELIKNKVASAFEHNSNTIKGSINVKDKKGDVDMNKLIGFIRISIKQKDLGETAPKRRPLKTVFGDKDSTKDVYQNFAKQVAERQTAAKPAEGVDPNFVNPVEEEVRQINSETEIDSN